jgi:hypothetical protein
MKIVLRYRNPSVLALYAVSIAVLLSYNVHALHAQVPVRSDDAQLAAISARLAWLQTFVNWLQGPTFRTSAAQGIPVPSAPPPAAPSSSPVSSETPAPPSPAAAPPTPIISGAPYPASQLITNLSFDAATYEQHGVNGGTSGGGDNWLMTYASDGNVYGMSADGRGWNGTVPYGMVLTRITNNPPGLTGIDVWSDNHIPWYPLGFIGDAGGVMRGFYQTNNDNFDGSYLMTSADNGSTWTDTGIKVFSHATDSLNTVGIAQAGPGYVNLPAGVDGSYYYVYLSVPNFDPGSFPGTPNIYLARVPKASLGTTSAYQYYNGLDGYNQPIWSTSISTKQPVFTDPNGMDYQLGVTYWPALNRWLLLKAHGIDKLGIFEGTTPWGPWRTVYYGAFRDTLRKFIYQAAQKWMSADGKTFWMSWSGYPEYDNVNFIKGTLVVLHR